MRPFFILAFLALLTTTATLALAGSGPGRQTDSECGLAGALNCGSATIDGVANCRWQDQSIGLAHCDVSITGTVLATNWVTPGSASASIRGYRCDDSQSTSWLANSGIINLQCSFSSGVWLTWAPYCVWWNTDISASFSSAGHVPRPLYAMGGPRACL